MWARKKAFDIRAQIASDARVCDADKSKVEPVLQPGARLISVMPERGEKNVSKDQRDSV